MLKEEETQSARETDTTHQSVSQIISSGKRHIDVLWKEAQADEAQDITTKAIRFQSFHQRTTAHVTEGYKHTPKGRIAKEQEMDIMMALSGSHDRCSRIITKSLAIALADHFHISMSHELFSAEVRNELPSLPNGRSYPLRISAHVLLLQQMQINSAGKRSAEKGTSSNEIRFL